MEKEPHGVDLTESGIKDQLRGYCQKTYENIPKNPKSKEEDTTPQLPKTTLYSFWKMIWTNALPKYLLLFINENQLQQ